ncbi:MAG: 30S ribosomal protein S8 [Thermodesulfobacteriota bacterium]
MSMTDPLADMLTRIRNASTARQEKVDVPASRLKLEVARILKEEGYIKNYKFTKDDKQGVIRIFLKYEENRRPVIEGMKRVSRPGRRIYTGADEIPKVLGGLGVTILSTSKGVMTDQEARRLNVGGEVLCCVW